MINEKIALFFGAKNEKNVENHRRGHTAFSGGHKS